jgi:hypothetical protein
LEPGRAHYVRRRTLGSNAHALNCRNAKCDCEVQEDIAGSDYGRPGEARRPQAMLVQRGSDLRSVRIGNASTSTQMLAKPVPALAQLGQRALAALLPPDASHWRACPQNWLGCRLRG